MKKYRVILSIFALLLLTASFLSLTFGTYRITISELLSAFLGKGSQMVNLIIIDIRLPRILTAIAVGIALSASGAILQTVTKNPLAEPGIIGINAGSALFVVCLISLQNNVYYGSLSCSTMLLIPIVSIAGAVLTAIVIYLISYKKGILPTRLILTGIGINTALNAVITLLQLNMSKGDYNQVLTWTSGSLWGSSWEHLLLSAPFIFILFGITFYKARTLDVMDLGDEIATGLGIKVEKERRALLLLSVCLAAFATSVAGNIAFLGILGPQISKQLTGAAHKRQLPIAALISAIVMIAADTVSRNLFSPLEIPAGITISLFGVPYFIYLIIKSK